MREKWDNNYFIGAVLIDFSKAFDCIHDLVISKLAANRFDKNTLCYIYSYLKRRKQCFSVNNAKSALDEIISGLAQESIVGPTV